MTTYPTQPTGDNSIDLNNIFASNSTNKIIMSTEEILDGYNNDGESETPLTSKPDGNKFNYFWYQVHNTLAWVVNYIKALYDNKLELSGGTMSGILNMNSNKISELSAGTLSTDAVNKGQLDSAVNGAMWLSEVKYLSYPNIPTLPDGIEIVNADGRALNKVTYSSLYSLIGTTYGGTELGTTFNIPDLRGKYVTGWNGSGILDSGRIFGSDQKRENSKYTWDMDYNNGSSKNSNVQYTAPQDGFIYIRSGCWGDYYLKINNIIVWRVNLTNADAYPTSGLIPISKGSTYISNTNVELIFYPKIQSTENSMNTQTNVALYPVIRIK
jgi:phage-related tail fiber protein